MILTQESKKIIFSIREQIKYWKLLIKSQIYKNILYESKIYTEEEYRLIQQKIKKNKRKEIYKKIKKGNNKNENLKNS